MKNFKKFYDVVVVAKDWIKAVQIILNGAVTMIDNLEVMVNPKEKEE